MKACSVNIAKESMKACSVNIAIKSMPWWVGCFVSAFWITGVLYIQTHLFFHQNGCRVGDSWTISVVTTYYYIWTMF